MTISRKLCVISRRLCESAGGYETISRRLCEKTENPPAGRPLLGPATICLQQFSKLQETTNALYEAGMKTAQTRPPSQQVVKNCSPKQYLTISEMTSENIYQHHNTGFCKYKDKCRLIHFSEDCDKKRKNGTCKKKKT